MKPGSHNAITDVPGVLVGHWQRRETGWATGTTVVLVPNGAVGAVDGRGGAPGTRETDLLAPHNLVQRANAVCLSGGSAYGLAAADGVMRWLAEHNQGFAVGAQPHEVVPIVPAAVLFDLPRSKWGNRPDAESGYAACRAAVGGPVAMGTVGAGTGAKLGSLKGGVGTASVVLDDGSVVGALVAANAAGEAVDARTGRPWAADLELGGEFMARWPDRPAELARQGSAGGDSSAFAARADRDSSAFAARADRDSSAFAARAGGDSDGGGRDSSTFGVRPLNTTIGVVATDVRLDKAQALRLAMAGQDGLARAVRPAHSMFDGDTVFALATGTRDLADGVFGLDRLCAAAADVFARAVVHALLAAESIPGLAAYREVWPESLSHVGRRRIGP